MLAVSLYEYISYTLIEHPLLLTLEIYEIFLLKLFFRKINLSSALTAIAFPCVDAGFLPNFFFGVMWNVNVFIMI